MKAITTIQEARGLPEKEFTIIIEKRQADGSVLRTLRFRDLVAVDRDDNAILCFVDSDGRIMGIDYDSEGAFKYPKGE